jgi:hypothetical protein
VGQRANFAATTCLRGREVKTLRISSRNGTMRIIAAYERRRRGCGVGKETIYTLHPRSYIHSTNNRLPGLSFLIITAFGLPFFGPRAFRGPGRLQEKPVQAWGCRPLMGAPGALSFAANRAIWTRTNLMGMLRRNGMRVLPSSRLFWHPKSVKYFLFADKEAFGLTKSISHQITFGDFVRLQ